MTPWRAVQKSGPLGAPLFGERCGALTLASF